MSLAKLGIKDESIRLFTVRELIEKDWLYKPLDGNHGEIHPKSEDFVASGVPFVMASDIVNGRVDYAQCNHITRKQADSLRKGFAHNGDVLLTHKATIGRTAIVSYAEQPYIMLTPQVTYYRVKNPREINNKYLRYFFDFQFFQDTIQLWAGAGSTRAYLGITEQQKLPVLLPEIKRQDKIAAVLSAYDDLIENNRRRIELLEKMAEELYREWFARFRFPGYQQAKFEKGIPAGWVVAELSKLAEVNARSIRKSREPQKVHYLDIGCVSTNEYTLPESIDFNNAPGRARRIVKHGDIIWSSVRPANRAYCLIYEPPENLVASTGFAVISHRQQVPYSFLKMAVTTDSFVEQMTVVAKGSAYPATSFEDFEKAKILLPPDGLLKEFDRHVEPLLKKINKLSKEDHILRQCRELLLPRLISGKLPVDQLDIQFPPSMREAAAARQEVAHA